MRRIVTWWPDSRTRSPGPSGANTARWRPPLPAFGDLDLAEDAVQEAFVVASRTWPQRGVPSDPVGWITTTARRRAIDRLRRESWRDRHHDEVARMTEHELREDDETGEPSCTTTGCG